jgi:glycosyltransferase involved in cell wall biosynthesis
MQPLVSVIIPIYNVERYLEKCINSVVNQTYRNIQIILVNDGSPDSSPFIADKYAQK